MLPANSSSAMWLIFEQIAQFWKTLFLISDFNIRIHWIEVLWRMKASSKCWRHKAKLRIRVGVSIHNPDSNQRIFGGVLSNQLWLGARKWCGPRLPDSPPGCVSSAKETEAEAEVREAPNAPFLPHLPSTTWTPGELKSPQKGSQAKSGLKLLQQSWSSPFTGKIWGNVLTPCC